MGSYETFSAGVRETHAYTSEKRGYRNFDDFDPDRGEAHAMLCEELGLRTHAERIRACTKPYEEGGVWYRRTCKIRFCPRCAQIKAKRDAVHAAKWIRSMRCPVVLLVTLCSIDSDDLGETLQTLRGCLVMIRKRWKPLSYIGNIEPHLEEKRGRWSAHIHLVVDAVQPSTELRGDVQQLNAKWKKLTDHRGSVSLDPSVHPRSIEALADYITKTQDWCPEPGQMGLKHRRVLYEALHGKQLTVKWRNKYACTKSHAHVVAEPIGHPAPDFAYAPQDTYPESSSPRHY